MNKLLGAGVLALGVAGLGYWGAKSHAERMQADITEAATRAVEGSVHGIQTRVVGRDITVTGLADGPDEKAAILQALNDVEGRRVVVDSLEVLPVADPYAFSVTSVGGVSLMQGNVPSEDLRDALAQSGADGAGGLTLAAGAPDRWEAAVGSGLAALAKLDEGAVSFEGTEVRLSGLVDTPSDRADVLSALVLPEGFTLQSEIETRDDGKPIGYSVLFDLAKGLTVSGKLPNGLSVETIGSTLQLSAQETDVTNAIGGDSNIGLEAIGKLRSWLPELDRANVDVSESGIDVSAHVAPAANASLIKRAMSNDLGDGVSVTVETVTNTPEAGAERTNVVTGMRERFEGGFWLPSVDFAPDQSGCSQQSDQVLSAARINFLSGSTTLGPRAVRAINSLAAVVRHCTLTGGLRAELGGHTDNTGSGNFQLSADRASVVRDALIARGVPGDAISAVGFGASKPIADNATAEGRAANRRTTITWAQ